MRSPARLRLLPLVLSLGWSVWFLIHAFRRWEFEYFYTRNFPFIRAELVEHYRRAFDWQTPLTLAALPLAALAVWSLLRKAQGLKTNRAA